MAAKIIAAMGRSYTVAIESLDSLSCLHLKRTLDHDTPILDCRHCVGACRLRP